MADWSVYTSELIYAYLNGHPFVGSYIPPKHAVLSAEAATYERRLFDPQPSPWEPAEMVAAASLLSAVSLKAAAPGLPNEQQRAALERAMDARIAELIDDYCGTPPGSPWPGPPPIAVRLAAGLSFLAATLGPGRLQATLGEVAAAILGRINWAALNPQPLPP